jgi:hypothetical protein
MAVPPLALGVSRLAFRVSRKSEQKFAKALRGSVYLAFLCDLLFGFLGSARGVVGTIGDVGVDLLNPPAAW